MDNPVLPKGQRVSSPHGQGEVEDIIGDKVVVKLDSGHYETFPLAEIADESSAG